MTTANYMIVICVIIILLKSSSAESFPATLKVSAAMTRVLSPPFLCIFLIALPLLFLAVCNYWKT